MVDEKITEVALTVLQKLHNTPPACDGSPPARPKLNETKM